MTRDYEWVKLARPVPWEADGEEWDGDLEAWLREKGSEVGYDEAEMDRLLASGLTCEWRGDWEDDELVPFLGVPVTSHVKAWTVAEALGALVESHEGRRPRQD